MKLAYSTLGWDAETERAMQAVAKIGYHGIELAAGPQLLAPEAWRSSEARRLKACAEDLGLVIANFHLGGPDLAGDLALEPSFLSPFEKHREQQIDRVCRGIDFAAEFGAGQITFPSGTLPAHLPPAAALDYLVNGLLRCLDHAGKAAMRIGVEPARDHLIQSYSAYIDLWNYFEGHPALGLCLNTGHAFCGYEDVPAIIADAPDIHHVHLKDMSARAEGPLIPGEGEMDLPHMLSALDGIGFDGFVSVELGSLAQDPEAMARASLAALMNALHLARAAA